jgi:hypothetical protein
MNREEFEKHWAQMNMEEHRELLQTILDNACIDYGLAPVPLRLENSGYGDKLGLIAGTYDSELKEVIVWGGVDYEGASVLDDPWEAITTVYHEMLHYAVLELDPHDVDNPADPGRTGITHTDIEQQAETLTATFFSHMDN